MASSSPRWGIKVHDRAACRWVTDNDRQPVTYKYRREAQAEADSMNQLVKKDIWKVHKCPT